MSEFAPGSTTPTATLTGLANPRSLAFDSSGNLYAANEAGGNGTTVSKFAPAQSFVVSGPTSGTYAAGTAVNIAWTAGNVKSGSKISLCYDGDTAWNGNEHWIEIDGVKAADGSGSYTWDTTGVQPGTYYVAGYLWNGGNTFTTSHLTQAITITAAAAQTFVVSGPTSGTYAAGTAVSIAWTAGNVKSGSKISLCYDGDTAWNGNEHWIEIDGVKAADGSGSYTWDTTGVQPGTYYVAGYLWNGGNTFTTSHLTQAITITAAAAQTFVVSGPTSGTYAAGAAVSIAWTAGNVKSGSKISLCYDEDTAWNGNEHWIEIDGVKAANGSGSYTWDTTGVQPGTYYVAGYLWNGGNTFTTLAPHAVNHDRRRTHLSRPSTAGSGVPAERRRSGEPVRIGPDRQRSDPTIGSGDRQRGLGECLGRDCGFAGHVVGRGRWGQDSHRPRRRRLRLVCRSNARGRRGVCRRARSLRLGCRQRQSRRKSSRSADDRHARNGARARL